MTKLLLIGWRATEYNFLQLLVEKLQGKVKTMAVTGDRKAAQETVSRLEQAGIKGDFTGVGSGFSEFIVSPDVNRFLGN